MIKYLTAIFFFAGLFIGVFFIVKHEKKRKRDKTVLVDTTRAAALVDSLYVTSGGVLISNDSTIEISTFDNRLNRLEKKAAQLQKEINRIKRKLDVYFAPDIDTFSIDYFKPEDFIYLTDTILWKAGILNDSIPWKAASITDTILWKAN